MISCLKVLVSQLMSFCAGRAMPMIALLYGAPMCPLRVLLPKKVALALKATWISRCCRARPSAVSVWAMAAFHFAHQSVAGQSAARVPADHNILDTPTHMQNISSLKHSRFLA
eukprot:3711824-Amphidinium_carterae.1